MCLAPCDFMTAVALVVDDSMLIRYTVCRFLEQRGFAVESATNGVEALEILERVQPDLIVTDMQMPKMSGSELITALKKQAENGGAFRSLLWPAGPAALTRKKSAPISPSIKISTSKASLRKPWKQSWARATAPEAARDQGLGIRG